MYRGKYLIHILDKNNHCHLISQNTNVPWQISHTYSGQEQSLSPYLTEHKCTVANISYIFWTRTITVTLSHRTQMYRGKYLIHILDKNNHCHLISQNTNVPWQISHTYSGQEQSLSPYLTEHKCTVANISYIFWTRTITVTLSHRTQMYSSKYLIHILDKNNHRHLISQNTNVPWQISHTYSGQEQSLSPYLTEHKCTVANISYIFWTRTITVTLSHRTQMYRGKYLIHILDKNNHRHLISRNTNVQ